jgi:hypothetical protein
MKKIFLFLYAIVFYSTLFLTNNIFAEIKVPGSGGINYWNDFEKFYKKQLKKSQKKKQKLIFYGSTSGGGWATGSKIVKDINDQAHEKAYKQCMKRAKKYTQNECFLFAINDKIVWTNIDEPIASVKLNLEIDENDKKPGRFFKDQPDITDEPQVHFIYILNKDSKDNEWDISGKMEKELLAVNEKLLKMTKGKQKFRYDMREDGKLDISFVRFNKQYKGNYGMNYPDAYLTQKGFNDPNKLYFAWADVKHRDGGQGSVHHGYIFLQSKYIRNADKRMMMTLHEILHVNGFAWPCTKGNSNGHTSSSTVIGGPVGDDSYRLGVLYDHGDDTCPDFKDSAFLDPTSENPFNPVELKCAMAAEVGQGKAPNENYDWRKRYSHKKLQKIKAKKTWCTYNVGN